MKRIFLAICLLCVTLVATQCKKNADVNTPPVTEQKHPITATLKGNIINENNLPVGGAVIRVGTRTITTDATGYFRLTNADLDMQTSLVMVEKSGYFPAYRVFAATSGTNQVTIKLIPKVLAGTLNATTGGQVTLPAGGKVTFSANGIVSATGGAAYSGTVNVYASYIDPTAADIITKVPGSFAGVDKDGNQVTLSSYGMMAVELQSTSGEKLQIKTGTTASLIIPIPASRVDETTGLWKEEGSATKNGSQYEGTVQHFSFWNCDYSMPAIYLSMKLVTANGQPIVNALVKLTNLDGSYFTQSWGYTDSLGQVSGRVPINAHLQLDVMNDCYVSIYTQNIGPFGVDTDLGSITVTIPTSNYINLHGVIVDCSNAPVTNGTAEIIYNNYHYNVSTDATGTFHFYMLVCSTTPPAINIIAIDHTAQQEGPLTTISVVTGNTDAGTLQACGTSSLEFLNYTLDGTNYSYSTTNPNSGIVVYDSTFNLHTLYAYGNGNNAVNISFTATGAGAAPVSSLYINGLWANIGLLPMAINITNYPTIVSEYYEGNFSGTFVDGSAGATHTLTLSFRAR